MSHILNLLHFFVYPKSVNECSFIIIIIIIIIIINVFIILIHFGDVLLILEFD